MSQLPSDPTLATPQGSRDEHAAALSAQSAASVAPAASATPPIHTPNRRRQSQRARAKATPATPATPAKSGNEPKDAKEPAVAHNVPAPETTSAAQGAEQSADHKAEATTEGAPASRRGRNPSRRASSTAEKPGRGGKANKAATTDKADAGVAPDTVNATSSAQPAATQPTPGAAAEAPTADAPLIVPVTTQEAHAHTGRSGRSGHRGGRGRERHAAEPTTAAEPIPAEDAAPGAVETLSITMEQAGVADNAAEPELAPATPQPEEPSQRYRFDRRPRVSPQPGGFAQPRAERLSGLYTTPTISPAALAAVTQPTQAAPVAPEPAVTEATGAETPVGEAVAPETPAPEAPLSESPAVSGARPGRRFGAPRRVRVNPIENAAPTVAPQAEPVETAAGAHTPEVADLTGAPVAPLEEHAAEERADESAEGEEEDTGETVAPARGATQGRSRRRRRKSRAPRAAGELEAEERAADGATAPAEAYDIAAPDEEMANGYAPEYAPGYTPGYARGYGRDYGAEYGEFAGPESYGEPYAPAPFTPTPYAPPAPTSSYAPTPYTPGGRLPATQQPATQGVGQWQGNAPHGVASTTGRNANPPAPTSPYGSPEPAFARGFGPQPNGVAGSARDQYTPYPRNGRASDTSISASQVNAAIRDAKETFQQQTDRLLTEMRRTVAPPTMTVAFPAMPSTERVGVFVDVANVLYSARNQRITVDFGRLLDFLRGNRRLIRAHAYAPTSPEPSADQAFLSAVKGLGYRITTKNYKTFASGAKKADLDLDMCMDIVRLVEAKSLDTIALVSGDSDFLPVLEYCSDHGVRVEVAAFEDSAAMILRQSCDVFINLSLLDEIRS